MFPQHFLKTQEFCFLASNLQPPLLGFVCLTWKALGWTSEENSKGKNLQRAPCVRVDQHLLGLARLNIFVSRHHRQWKGRPDPQTHPNPKERYQHLGVVGTLKLKQVQHQVFNFSSQSHLGSLEPCQPRPHPALSLLRSANAIRLQPRIWQK